MLITRKVIWIFSLWMMVSGASTVWSQNYPTRPIRIVTFGIGGDTDFAARLVAQGIAVPLGEPVIVENRGNGVIPGEIVFNAPADGYTVLIAGGNFWLLPLFQKAPYDVVKDFSPVTYIGKSPLILAVHPSVPAKSVKELIALAKARPNALNYASGNTGASSQVAAELLEYMGDIKMQGIPYSSGSMKIISLMSGQVDLMFDSVGVLMPNAKIGKIRALAITSAQPSMLAPGFPTMAASGLPGYEVVGSTGMFVRSNTPATIVRQLNQETVRLLKSPETRERLASDGAEVVGNSPEEFATSINSEQMTIAKIIKATGIHAE